MAKRARKEIPYWLAADDVRCGACEHTHAFATAAHCVACDRSFCPLCIVVVAGEVYCPECHDEGRPAKWRRGQSGKA